MKRYFIAVMMVVALLNFTACTHESETSPHTENTYSDLYPQSAFSENSDDTTDAEWLSDLTECEYNKFYEFKVKETASYNFEIVKTSSKADEKLKWFIYVLDESFVNGLRYLYESNNPDCTIQMDEAVSLNLVENSYIYCFCSYNEYNATSDTAAGAYLLIERE